MAHDRMEMKTEKLLLLDCLPCILYRPITFQRINGAPGLANHAWMIVAHPGDVLVGTRRRAGDRFDIKSDEHRLDTGLLELLDDFGFFLPCPSTVPILCQRFDVGAL